MKIRHLLIFFSLLALFASGQNAVPTPTQTFPLHVEGYITDLKDNGVPGAQVTVNQGGKIIATITTDGTGKYAADLPLNNDYTIMVSKPGMVTKKYTVSTRGVPPEKSTSKFSTVEASMTLFEKLEGVDYSFLNQPLNKYNYNPVKDNFEYDKFYLDQMLGGLENLMQRQAAEIEKRKNLEKNYQDAVKNGDKLFGKGDYQGAKAAYQQALGLKPNETWPKQQMTQIDKIIADQEALNKKKAEDAKKAAEDAAAKKAAEDLNAKYLAAIKKGDDAFAKKDWAVSKAGYNEALSYKAAETYPKTQLAAIDKAIADAAKADADAKAKAELEAKYLAAIKKGDDAFAKKDWANSKAGFNEALGYKPTEQYPKDKIAAIDKAMAEEAAAKAKADADAKNKAELEAKYTAAIKKGDEAFAKKDWTTAKGGYNEALGIKANEVYPKNQLAAVDKAMADEAAAKAKADADAKAKAELEAKYLAAIKKGDDAFAKKDWPAAKGGYNEALGVKPAEQYPKDKIAAIDKAIADENAAKSKAELDAKYAAAVKKGDDAFAKKDWANAKAGYNEALSVKASEQYPKDKIAAIDKAIADENAAKSKAELDAKYTAAIKKGDEAFAKKDWVNAKAGYNEALGVKPAEQYPKDKIAAIDKAIADDAAAKAKADADAKSKAELEAKYAAAIKKGDEAFAKKDWATAKGGFNDAIALKPAEQYPKDKIAAIDKAIADENAAKSKAEIEAKYAAAIKKGDEAFAKKDWSIAKGGYNEALAVKPAEKYPKDQIAIIDKTLADEAAAKAKADADAKSKAELEAKYAAAIKKGDDAFSAKNWPTARTGYNEAIGFKPAEQYPKDRLAAIDKAIADEKLNMDAAAKAKAEAELKAKYDAAIKKGDDGFAAKSWIASKAAYNEALGYKPAEKYPKDQIALIDKAIADDAANKAKADADAKAKAELDAKYNAAIKKGDDAFKKKDWAAARTGYNEAIGIKSSEQYPKDQLAAIDKAITDEKSNMDAAAKAKAEAELNAKYTAALKKGDDAFKKKDWANSKAGYNEALGFKPAEQYPKDQLAAIDKAIADEKSGMDAAAKAKAQAELDAKYNAAIKKGDDAYTKKDWATARTGFTEALTYKPNEQYPKDKLIALDKIAEAIKNAGQPTAEDKYNAAIKVADANFGAKKYKDAKKNYEEALIFKGGDAYAMGKLAEIEKLLNSDAAVTIDEKQKALLAKYPPGVTEETINGNGVVIIQRVVVKNNYAMVFQKKIFNWGGVQCFRDGSAITELTFENETKP
jgi:hypothetical protein